VKLFKNDAKPDASRASGGAPKKRRRPATGKSPAGVVRFPPALIATVDTWARKAGDVVTRSEAIRRLVELGLKRRRNVRLSVVMLLCVFAFGLCKGASDGKRGVVSNDYRAGL
jgi:hypothetical protein